MQRQIVRFILACVFLCALVFLGPTGPTSVYAAGTWEPVGAPGFSPGAAAYTSLAVHNGTPYVAYANGVSGNKAAVMKYNGASWVAVGTSGFSAGQADYTSLALDSSGTPCVAYSDVPNGHQTTAMKYDGVSGNWVLLGTIAFSAGPSPYTSLVVDSSGAPLVAFQDGGFGSRATVMKYNVISDVWLAIVSAGFTAGQADYTSLAVDGSNTPYVAFADGANSGKASVMKYDSGSTSWILVGSAGFSTGAVQYTSLAIEGGMPYVAYQDVSSSKATVMKYSGGSWVFVGSSGFTPGLATNLSLVVSNGIPYVAFRDGSRGDKATVMKYNGVNWVNLGSPGFSAGEAGYTSLAISNGMAYVAYMDQGPSHQATVMKREIHDLSFLPHIRR